MKKITDLSSLPSHNSILNYKEKMFFFYINLNSFARIYSFLIFFGNFELLAQELSVI